MLSARRERQLSAANGLCKTLIAVPKRTYNRLATKGRSESNLTGAAPFFIRQEGSEDRQNLIALC
jgi:hypothetical protein